METGFNAHRLKEGDDYYKKEIDFVKVFNEDHSSSHTMDYIVFGMKPIPSIQPKDILTERERKIVLSIIQWLGTPAGQRFIDKVNDLK